MFVVIAYEETNQGNCALPEKVFGPFDLESEARSFALANYASGYDVMPLVRPKTPTVAEAMRQALLWEHVDRHIENGRIIDAIRTYRAGTGEGLKDSKDAVEARARAMFEESKDA